MQTPESLRSLCERFLPLETDRFVIGIPVLSQMIGFQEELGTDELPRLTCRPIKEHSKEEREALYAKTLMDVGALTLGIQDGGGGFDTSSPIFGKISVFDFNPRNKSAEFGYVLLPSRRRQGVMKDALRAVCYMLLRDAGLNKLYAQTGAFNEPSVALLGTLGFHLDGRLREHHALDGVLYDDLVFSLLKKEL